MRIPSLLLMRGSWPLMQVQQKKIHIDTHIASHIHIVTHARFTYSTLVQLQSGDGKLI